MFDIIKEKLNHYSLLYSDKQIEVIVKSIELLCKKNKIDFDSLIPLGDGESSVVFTDGNIIIKVVPAMTTNVSVSDYVRGSNNILQPYSELNLYMALTEEHCFEILISVVLEEKLNLDNITYKDAMRLAESLYYEGYAWIDIRPENIGRDENGKLKLFDYGELFNKKYDPYYEEHIEEYKKKLDSIDKYYKFFSAHQQVKENVLTKIKRRFIN